METGQGMQVADMIAGDREGAPATEVIAARTQQEEGKEQIERHGPVIRMKNAIPG